MIWFVLGLFAGASVGILVMALATAAKQDEWQVAYLNCRDQLWRLERDQGGA